MSLLHGYSSDEENAGKSVMEDAFGVASLPAAKRPRLDGETAPIVQSSAPDVLAEVRTDTGSFCGPYKMMGLIL